MSDLSDRKKREAALAAVILLLFRKYARETTIDWKAFRTELAKVLAGPLANVYEQAANKLVNELKTEFRPARNLLGLQIGVAAASRWSVDYSNKLAEAVVNNTKKALDAVKNGGQERVIRSLETGPFSKQRASTIATTEVTRANSAGEDAVVDIAKKAGMKLVGIWVTAQDDLVCKPPIQPNCQQLNGKGPRTWALVAPAGPPLHPNCRCYLRYQLAGDTQEAWSDAAREKSAETRRAHKKPQPVKLGRRRIAVVFDAKKKIWRTTSGAALPAHHAKTYISPGLTNVQLSSDPTDNILATGVDSRGRSQRIYRPEFVEQQARAKFERVVELLAKFTSISKQNQANLKNPALREAAAVMRLIMTTGLRPGSRKDTKAAKRAYGATTLLAQHVVKQKDGVHLKFVGKKGVSLDIPITDKAVAADLLKRKAAAGAGKPIFLVTDKQLRVYSHSLDGGGFKPKDFRTALGTRTAAKLVAKGSIPKDEKQYKKMVREVAVKVSTMLGNTPTVALQSYIAPQVFDRWKKKVFGQ